MSMFAAISMGVSPSCNQDDKIILSTCPYMGIVDIHGGHLYSIMILYHALSDVLLTHQV